MSITSLLVAQITAFLIGWAGPWRDPPELRNNGRVARPIRMGLSFSLVVGALLVWIGSPPASVQAAYSAWALGGMSASFIGDLIMARLIPLSSRLIGGMIAFGAAHALYVSGYLAAVRTAGGSIVNAGLCIALVLYGAATYLGWRGAIRNPSKPRAINAGALLYGAWVALMAAVAAGMAAALGGTWWLAALGGLSFVVSDFLIGVTDIGQRHFQNANDWIWLTYLAGQMGIIYAAAVS